MSLIRFDGFDPYDGTSAVIAQRGWTSSGSIFYSQTGRFTGSKSLRLGAGAEIVSPHGSALSTVSIGIAVNARSVSSASATGTDLIRFKNGSTTIAKLGMTSTGLLVTGRADFTTNKIADSGAVVLTSLTFNYIEIEFTRSASVGVFKVYLNGAVVINSTGVNTGATDVDGTSVNALGFDTDIDDFYHTNTGTRLGERRVEYLVPTADTAQKDWGASTGTAHWSLLDEVPCNGDTDYVTDATAGHKDTYDLANLSSTPAAIDAVQTIFVGRKDDATTRQVRNYIVSGGTNANGTTQNMGASYSAFVDIFATDPNTAGAWNAASVNALQLGLEVVT